VWPRQRKWKYLPLSHPLNELKQLATIPAATIKLNQPAADSISTAFIHVYLKFIIIISFFFLRKKPATLPMPLD